MRGEAGCSKLTPSDQPMEGAPKGYGGHTPLDQTFGA